MAAESDADRLAFFNFNDFGVSATIGAGSVAGMLEKPYIGIDLQQGPVISADAPVFFCRTIDVAGVTNGQAVTIEGASYTVAEVRPDGDGVTALVLRDA